MNYARILSAILIMAVVTYATRAIPLLLCRKKIENKYVLSFLTYLPYGVLAAMVFPEIFTSTALLVSGIAGAIVAIALAYRKHGLITVALGATLTVFVTEQIAKLIA